MATIRYYIPEDGDIEDQPNVFLAPKPAQPGFSPKLGEIRQAFPLPGKYHFRFKSALVPGSDRDKDCVPVWMDCVDDNQHVAVWKGGIFAKVTRISMESDALEDKTFISSNDMSAVHKNVEMPSQSILPPSASTVPVASQHSQPTQVATEILLDVFDTPTVRSGTVSSIPSTATTDPYNIFGGTSSTSMYGVPSSEGSLLDMDTPAYSSGQPSSYASAAHADFLGMTATVTPPNGAQVPNATNTVRPVVSQPSSVPMAQTAQSKLPPSRSGSTNAFNSFSQKAGPFGDLGWK